MKDFADKFYIDEALKKVDRHNDFIDAFVYSMIAARHDRVEKAIKEILATKVYPPIKRPYGKFWMKIMLWMRGVKILQEQCNFQQFHRNFDTKIIVKQFGYVVGEKYVKGL